MCTKVSLREISYLPVIIAILNCNIPLPLFLCGIFIIICNQILQVAKALKWLISELCFPFYFFFLFVSHGVLMMKEDNVMQ